MCACMCVLANGIQISDRNSSSYTIVSAMLVRMRNEKETEHLRIRTILQQVSCLSTSAILELLVID